MKVKFSKKDFGENRNSGRPRKTINRRMCLMRAVWGRSEIKSEKVLEGLGF